MNFDWETASPPLDEVVERGWKMEAMCSVLIDKRGRKPTRNALAGYLHRHEKLRDRWHEAMKRERTRGWRVARKRQQ
jgi:hypothetical protein